jgi:outer membrane protein assembly factor BamB
VNGSTSRPPIEIYAPGKSPVYRSPLQKAIPFGGWILTAILTFSINFLIGGDIRDREAILIDERSTVTYLYHDPVGHSNYAVIDNSEIVALDFNGGKTSSISSAPSVDSITLIEDHLYYCSEVNREVVSIDLATGKKRWTLSKISGARALVAGENIAFLATAERRLIVVDPERGSYRRSIKLPGVPFDLVLYRGRYYVSIFDSDLVLAVDPKSGEIVGRYRTDPGPDSLGANGQGVWVASRLTHTLRLLGDDVTESKGFVLANQETALASNGNKLAISGIEQITTVDTSGNVDRILFADEAASAVAVGADGEVLFAEAGRIFLVNPK